MGNQVRLMSPNRYVYAPFYALMSASSLSWNASFLYNLILTFFPAISTAITAFRTMMSFLFALFMMSVSRSTSLIVFPFYINEDDTFVLATISGIMSRLSTMIASLVPKLAFDLTSFAPSRIILKLSFHFFTAKICIVEPTYITIVLLDCGSCIFSLLIFDESEAILVVITSFGNYWIQFAIFGEFLPEFFL